MSVIQLSTTERRLNTVIKLAEANDSYPKWRLGAMIIKGGSTRAIGINKLHTPAAVASDEHLDCLSTHAEEDALKRCKHPKGTTMYLARVGRNNKPALARPCKTCEKLLRKAGVKKVFYTIGPREYGVLNL